MIRSCVFNDELSSDFQRAIDLCAELRVPAIEARGGLWGQNINSIDLDGAKKMQQIMDVYGVKVGCIGSGFGKCSLTDPDEWQQHLDIIHRQMTMGEEIFDCKLIRTFPFWVPEGIDWQTERPDLDAYLPQILEKMGPVVKEAEERGFTFTMEAEGTTFSGDCLEIRTIIDAMGSPALTTCWDVANSWTNGRVAWPDDYPLVKGTVTHLHVKDCTFAPGDPSKKTGRTYMDEGEIPWAEILKQLIEDGYEGYASVETHLFFGMADRFRWLEDATINALRNLNRTLAQVQGVL